MARVASSGAGGAGGSPTATGFYAYAQVATSSGIETLITTFTADTSFTYYVQLVTASSQNVAAFKFYLNGTVIDQRYCSYQQFNVEFPYFTGNTNVPGIKLNSGDIVKVTGLQSQGGICNMNALIQILGLQT
jgi:hypothetical protein